MNSLLIENQYFGTVNYYKMLFQYTHIEIEQYEFYQKMSFRNRCTIVGANGLVHLSVPLEKGRNQREPIKAVKIAYRDNWVLQHCRSLEACYNRSPYFEFYREELLGILEKRPIFLADLNMELLQWVLKKAKSSLTIQLTDEYHQTPKQGFVDGRNKFLPKNLQSNPTPIRYTQVFEDRIGFMPNMSILDLLFCAGPPGLEMLKSNEKAV